MKLLRLKTPEPCSVILSPEIFSDDLMIASFIKAVFWTFLRSLTYESASAVLAEIIDEEILVPELSVHSSSS